jgi:hypothetical protein
VSENTGNLLLQRILLDTVVVVKSCVCAPANVQRGVYVGLRPFHDLAKLVPIVYFFKGKILHGCAGDDHAVKLFVFDGGELGIKRVQMLLGSIFGAMGLGGHQANVHLQGGVGKQAKQLGLRHDLGGHQIQNCDPQRADILGGGTAFVHDENILLGQCLGGR